MALLGPSNGNEYSGTDNCSEVFCNTELAGFLRGVQHSLMGEMKKNIYLFNL